MDIVTLNPADTLSTLAARIFPGEDVSRFTELLDANPGLDPIAAIFDNLPENLQLNLPSTEQIESFAAPVLTAVSSSLGGAKGFLEQAEQTLTSISGKLPPQLQGYAKEALDLVGEANGVLGEVEGAIASTSDKLREYAGQGTQLIPWLLSGKA
jgi:phage tail protein X